jgi:predicted peptidase
MAQTSDSIRVEPGKQLPQSLTIRIESEGEPCNVTIHYLLFVPKDYEPNGKKWPLMLFLHGYGECGNGTSDLNRVKLHGPPGFVDSRPDFPFVVITPQCPQPKYDLKEIAKAWKSEQLIQLVDHVADKLNIDPTRVYATGLSMGGFGTWRLVAAHPERFAAALPICGGGNKPEAMAKSLRRVPIWTFHGARDSVVPLSMSQDMVDAVRRAGGDVKLTVYPDIEHNSWKQTYDNPKVYDWLLSHRGPM